VNASALMAKEDYVAAGGFDADLAEYALEDWDFWLTMLERGKRGTYVRAPLLRWRRHAEGSRNPESQEKLARSAKVIRDRHRALYERTSDWRGRLGYAIELAFAVAELGIGFSRSPGFLSRVERQSWRRFQRWHSSCA
jgi:hypothetical protein